MTDVEQILCCVFALVPITETVSRFWLSRLPERLTRPLGKRRLFAPFIPLLCGDLLMQLLAKLLELISIVWIKTMRFHKVFWDALIPHGVKIMLTAYSSG